MRRFALGLALAVAGCTTTSPSPAPPAPRGPRYDVEPVSGLGFFADERERSRQLLSAGLAQRGLDTAPVELERAWALAAEGKSPLTGQDCGKPLSRYAARKRWGTALGVDAVAAGHVWCGADGGCELSVSGGPVDGEGDRFRWLAPIAREGDAFASLQASVARLAPPPADELGGGGLGLLGGLAGPQPIQREDRLEVSAWLADERAPERRAPTPALEGLTVEQVSACLSPGDDSLGVLVDVRGDASLGRCEGAESEPPAAAACACALLAKAKPAAVLAGARWTVNLRVDRRDQLTQDGKLVLVGWWRTYLERYRVAGDKYPRFRPKVEHPSIADWTAPTSRLTAACFTGAFAAPGRLNTRWAVWFDSRGRPTRIVEQKGFPPLAKDVAACVSESLKTSQAPCPARANLWAMADFSVEARDPSAPVPPLSDLLEKKAEPADGGVSGP